MDIKLKNRHKLAVFVIICTILISALYVGGQYYGYYEKASKSVESSYESVMTSADFLGHFLEAGYILYNEENAKEDTKEILNDCFYENLIEFQDFYPYLDYYVEDGEKNPVDSSTANTKRTMTEEDLSSYEFGLIITYDEKGNPDIKVLHGEYEKEQRVQLRKILSTPEYYNLEILNEGEFYGLESPVNRTYYYAMTEENVKKYVNEQYYMGFEIPDYAIHDLLILMLLAAVAAWIYPLIPSWNTGQEKIFTAPFEVVVIVLVSVWAAAVENYTNLIYESKATASLWDYMFWTAVFAVVYWGCACLRQIYVMGISEYMRKRSLLYASKGHLKRVWTVGKEKLTGGIKRVYHSLEKVDLSEKSTKFILKIVAVNFVILTVVCSMWVFGIMALIIYSVILFFILRKYYDDLQKKYGVLLKATNRIAEGELDVEITEDLGVFSPFRTEIEKIQRGFKKAVDEEVKSQHMKTELITNVSHDLKTPLTAIITYVNLLKDEKDEEKRRNYINVLESKSLRLKVLIEDLFEISKASSKNITLHIVDVDIVNLFKQVKLELEDKFRAANIEFRCTWPGEKLIVPLDSQKTYRIFENLLVNISKYAMPNTRAYVEIIREGEEAVVRVKNISASELTFNPEEITERFVRGDVSRNTEGSGLGLAIAKSFTELQKGKFKIETEADLFKAEIRFVC